MNSVGQRQFLREFQGNRFPHGRLRGDRPQSHALIMQPAEFSNETETYLTWLVGIQSGYRVQANYDSDVMELNQKLVDDGHINFAPVFALPTRGLMAIEDRSAEGRISAKQAIAAFRSVILNAFDSMSILQVRHGDPADIQRWISEWDLLEYAYTISPLNPISASELAEKRSEAMKRENIARDSGRVQPPEGQSMRPSEGIIEEANELAEVGYAQRGFKGRTEDGHLAHVQKPKFHYDHNKNLAEQQKPQFVRVLFEKDDAGDVSPTQIVEALRRFYRGD